VHESLDCPKGMALVLVGGVADGVVRLVVVEMSSGMAEGQIEIDTELVEAAEVAEADTEVGVYAHLSHCKGDITNNRNCSLPCGVGEKYLPGPFCCGGGPCGG
jgi:hypothetical protein